MQSWASYLTSPSLSFLNYKMGLTQWVTELRDNVVKLLSRVPGPKKESRTMKWELQSSKIWRSKINSQDTTWGGKGRTRLILASWDQATEPRMLIQRHVQIVGGVLSVWTLKHRHPGSPAPWHLCPELSPCLGLLQRALISDRGQQEP